MHLNFRGITLFGLVLLVLSMAQFGLNHKYAPGSKESRDIALADVLDKNPLHLSQGVSPETLCQAWTAAKLEDVDCRAGRTWRTVDSAKQASDASRQELLKNAFGDAKARVLTLQTWHGEVEKNQPSDSSLRTTLLVMQSKLLAFEGSLARIEEMMNDSARSSEAYVELFELHLQLYGVTYQSTTGHFIRKKWDLLSIVDQPQVFEARAYALRDALAWLMWTPSALSLLLLPLAWWRDRWFGFCSTTLYLLMIQIGLLITADASVHFGQESPIFPLNPLSYALNRQWWITVGTGICMAVILAWPRVVHRVVQWLGLRPIWTTWVIALLVLTAYAAKSPALGLEMLKLGMAILASQLIADQGRALHLVQKYAPETLHLRTLLKFRFRLHSPKHDPQLLILHHVGTPLVNYLLFMAVILFASSLIFNDLGGTLIASMITLTSLFFAFGYKPAVLSLLGFSLAGGVLSVSEKLQARIELMLTPMTASISDFARLLSYTDAAAEHSFGLGHLKWCNPMGSCLPIQVLSDYMPTAINGVAGPHTAWALFALLGILLMTLCAVACWRYLTQHDSYRMVAICAFFLALSSLVQLALTFLGNWRVIPLTGLGTPLMSIGISSMLAPCLALSLLMISHPSKQSGAMT